MHFAWQSTSPEEQAFRQAASEAWAASVVVTEATGVTEAAEETEATEETDEETMEADWALTRTAKAPATRKLVKCILDVYKV